MLLTFYGVVITTAWVITSIYIIVNSAKIAFLKNLVADDTFIQPAVVMIIAVKDEEAEVEAALTSICNLAYSNYRILVINDRSTDRTGEILAKMEVLHPSISVITIHDLPPGWLGKNHALYQGYLQSGEEWMLFTDADVHYSVRALARAMNYVRANRLDHLTVLPEITSPSSLFKAVMNTFSIMLEVKLRPWAVSDPSSDASIGVGAFNLVSRVAYERAGTHVRISLRPDDDLKLGENIKRAGLRQGVVYGEKEIWLQWYSNLSEFVRGLMKNTFSVSNYHLPTAIAMATATFIIFVLPLPVLLITGRTGQGMAVLILLSQVILMSLKKGINGKWWHALLIPFSGLVMVFILLKSALTTLKQGGIYWRDSFYPLDELRKQR
jgi:glycosyltransferase involved in cell wall biosynthesis